MPLLSTLTAVLSALALSAPPSPSPGAPPPAAATLVIPAEGTAVPEQPGDKPRGPVDDAALYATMERGAPNKVTEFRGGSVAVYASSGVVLVLVIVLLVVLL